MRMALALIFYLCFLSSDAFYTRRDDGADDGDAARVRILINRKLSTHDGYSHCNLNRDGTMQRNIGLRYNLPI